MIRITGREAKEMLISVVAISLALAINQMGVMGALEDAHLSMQIASFFLVALGTGFILHEMAHKFTAIYFGHRAEFRMWAAGLGFMFLLALLPTKIMFIAPGAVYIGGGMKRITQRENGIISLAGPFTNVVIALIAIAALLVVGPIYVGSMGLELLSITAWINIFLALFNLIPVYPLDGSKVLAWNKFVYGGFAAIALFLFFMVGGF